MTGSDSKCDLQLPSQCGSTSNRKQIPLSDALCMLLDVTPFVAAVSAVRERKREGGSSLSLCTYIHYIYIYIYMCVCVCVCVCVLCMYIFLSMYREREGERERERESSTDLVGVNARELMNQETPTSHTWVCTDCCVHQISKSFISLTLDFSSKCCRCSISVFMLRKLTKAAL